MNNCKKVFVFYLMIFFVFAFLTGCYGTRQTEFSDSVKEEDAHRSSADEPPVDTHITLFPTPEFNDILPVHSKRHLAVFPANDAVVVMNSEFNVIIEGVIAYEIVDLERRGQLEYSSENKYVGLLFEKRHGDSDVLVFTDGQDAMDIAVDVIDFHISYDGRRIAYRTRTGEYDPAVSADQYDAVIGGFYDRSIGALHVFDTQNKESLLISQYADEQYALSPSGTAIAFMKIFDLKKPEDWRCLYGIIGEDYIHTEMQDFPVALTDDISLVYVMERDAKKDSFGVYKQSVKTILSPQLLNRENSKFIFSRDCTEVLINDAEGIKYSTDGQTAELIEPSFMVLTDREQASKSDDVKSFLQVDTLKNQVYIVSSDFGYSKTLWYLRGDGKSEKWSSVAEGKRIAEHSHQRVDSAVLFGNSEEMILVEHIYVPEKMDIWPIDSVSTRNFLLSSNHTVYYYSSDKISEAVYRAGLEKFGTELYEMSALYSEARQNAAVISLTCVSMKKMVRSDQPDIIYYLEYAEPQTTKDEYIAWRYNSLYAIEDVPGAVPVLLAENVSEIDAGEFGVFYIQLNQAGAGTAECFTNNEHSGSLWDTVDVFYSTDGLNFQKITTVSRAYLLHSAS